MLRKQNNDNNNLANLSFEQMRTEPSRTRFAVPCDTEALTGLEKVNEESNYCSHDFITSLNNGQTDFENLNNQLRPSSTNELMTDSRGVLVTPMPIQN